jgi:hypothetical protein
MWHRNNNLPMNQQRLHFIYPSDPLKTKQPDEFYRAEFAKMQESGFGASVFSFEEFQSGSLRLFPAPPVDAQVLYRGWMLSAETYPALVVGIEATGAKPFTNTATYLAAHHLPEWYPFVAEFTPETRIFPPDTDLATRLHELNWPEYFIKDYVKSLKTSVGSRISSPEQAALVTEEMRRFRGTIEGGFCVRRVEDFNPGSEKRYFVLQGIPHAMAGVFPIL